MQLDLSKLTLGQLRDVLHALGLKALCKRPLRDLPLAIKGGPHPNLQHVYVMPATARPVLNKALAAQIAEFNREPVLR